MKLVLCFLCLSMVACTLRQISSADVITADEEFARLSRERSTRDAFLATLDDSSILFRPDSVNGIKFWTANPDRGDLLFWQPAYAVVSTNEDLGVTIGPYYLQPSRHPDSTRRFGHYLSVWRKRATSWKLVMDLGISHNEMAFPKETMDLTQNIIVTCDTGVAEVERSFVSSHKEINSLAYENVTHNEIQMLRPGYDPILKDSSNHFLKRAEMRVEYTYRGAYTSSSCDLGYAYGDAVVELTESGQRIPLHYIRVWQQTRKGWKILFDIVGF